MIEDLEEQLKGIEETEAGTELLTVLTTDEENYSQDEALSSYSEEVITQ